MKHYKRSLPSVTGGMIHEDNAVRCSDCQRIMAKWDYADHCCEYIQLFEFPVSKKRTQPVMFGGAIVGKLVEQGDKLAYYLPDNNIPYVVLDNPALLQMWEVDV